MSGRVLVTGASGFLGRPLVDALLDQGREVVALSRRPPADRGPQGPTTRRLERRAGDVRDERSWRDVLEPGTTVFHLAAARAHPRQRSAHLEAVNCGATAALARASAERGVARFVQVSTALVFGPARGGPRRERDGLAPPPDDSYAASRAAAIVALEPLVASGLHAVVLCPTIVYGPDDPAHRNRTTSEIRRLLATRIEILPAGGAPLRDLVYRDDVVAAMVRAEELGRPGEIFLIGGEAAAQREFNRRVLAAAGVSARLRLVVPGALVGGAARAADRLLGLERGSGYTRAFTTLGREWTFDSAAARARLTHRPLSLADGLARTVAWLRSSREAEHWRAASP